MALQNGTRSLALAKSRNIGFQYQVTISLFKGFLDFRGFHLHVKHYLTVFGLFGSYLHEDLRTLGAVSAATTCYLSVCSGATRPTALQTLRMGRLSARPLHSGFWGTRSLPESFFPRPGA